MGAPRGKLTKFHSTHARFTPQFLDELRARLSVSEVVGKRVKLKKAGREWKGLSPFSRRRRRSFYVNDQKGFTTTSPPASHGDIITFVMETDGLRPFAGSRSNRLANAGGSGAAGGGHARCRASKSSRRHAARRDGPRRKMPFPETLAVASRRKERAAISRRSRAVAGDAQLPSSAWGTTPRLNVSRR